MDREYILQEIRRTAKANGGVPLGMARFSTETGIKLSDWRGVYWARWSDAVGEAGLSPNTMTVGYDDTELLAIYGQLALELGRLPTSPEMRLKARNEPNFPHEGAFRRLGTKAQLVCKLLEHCRTRSGLDAVIRMCEEYVPRNRVRPDAPRPDETQFGSVYLIKSGRHYKIGKSNAAGRREYELRILLPEKVTPVHEIRTDDPAGIEAYWHRRFKAKRKRGEWFYLDPEDVAAFKRRKHFM